MINRKGQKESFSESWMFLLFSNRAVKHLFQLIGGRLKKIPPPLSFLCTRLITHLFYVNIPGGHFDFGWNMFIKHYMYTEYAFVGKKMFSKHYM